MFFLLLCLVSVSHRYQLYTKESPDKAVTRAKQDADEIQDYLMTPRTNKLMMRRLSC